MKKKTSKKTSTKPKNEKVEVFRQDILKAYNAGCDDVKTVLRNLYPSVVKEEDTVPLAGCTSSDTLDKIVAKLNEPNNNIFIDIRCTGEYKNRGLFVEGMKLVKDSEGEMVLVPEGL